MLAKRLIRNKFLAVLCSLTLIAGCAGQPPSAATIAALRTEPHMTKAVVDSDCMYSVPVRNQYIAYRLNGLCLFSDSELRLYYGGEKPPLAFALPITAIKSWAFHPDIFTVVTEAGNFGLVLKDSAGFVAVLRAHGIPENDKLPVFRAKDPSPFAGM
jgi:hypothetical protein